MKQWFRLVRSTDIKRVRRTGKSYAHPLVVLVLEKAAQPGRLQVGVIAGKSTGGAVTRNLIKRRIRAILDRDSHAILKGWNVLIIARTGAGETSFSELRAAILSLLRRARIFNEAGEEVGA